MTTHQSRTYVCDNESCSKKVTIIQAPFSIPETWLRVVIQRGSTPRATEFDFCSRACLIKASEAED